MNIEAMPLEKFYKGKCVLVTGHTGFKGSWLSLWLNKMGARVFGYSVDIPTSDFDTSLYKSGEIVKYDIERCIYGDIRDFELLQHAFDLFKPEIIFHLAAQPIISEGYANPRYTYETNVMGTINVLEAARNCPTVESIAIITTDKVYDETQLKPEYEYGYKEWFALNGFDPYSNSKSCADIATQCYINCYMKQANIPVSIFRAGNVIGGGDFAKNRIVPDYIRAWKDNELLSLRNPYAIRPYQHVLEPLYIYLTIAMNQTLEQGWDDIYNIGPNSHITTEELIQNLDKYFKDNKCAYIYKPSDMKENQYLRLDCQKLKATGWQPVWDIDTTAKAIYCWYDAWNSTPHNTIILRGIMHNQIEEYLKDVRK